MFVNCKAHKINEITTTQFGGVFCLGALKKNTKSGKLLEALFTVLKKSVFEFKTLAFYPNSNHGMKHFSS